MPIRNFGRSPASREPLLASAQTPGTSQRISDASFASGDHPSGMPTHRGPGGPAAGASFSSATNPRYGPTASISPAPSSAGAHGSTLGSGAGSSQPLHPGAGAAGPGYADDDLDDALHTFTAADRKDLSTPFDITSWRGWANGLMLFFLLAALIVLFAGYPIINWWYDDEASSGSSTSGYNLGGVNSSGQVPDIANFPTLIDADTPSDVYTRTGFDGNTWTLVFSDEFEKDGRTFYDGDDPFWTAMDFNYWATGDFEWYDPSAITTKDGHLVITMTQEPIHDLNFKSGMLQSWNQLCFNVNGYIEVSLSLPGTNAVAGFWPGVWAMGNLGRPGYGATTNGMWPYSYDSCDVGILPNQTWVNGTGPAAALDTGASDGTLSYLPGQRASACTCEGQPHPGPSNDVGRGAVEIDLLEAQIVVDGSRGQVSQSAQFAPFNAYYQWTNTSDTYTIANSDMTAFNSYLGGEYQQAVSALTYVDDDIYYGTSGDFAVFGVEWSSNKDDRASAYITWVSQGQESWSILGSSVGPDDATGIGQRLVSEEPMALVVTDFIAEYAEAYSNSNYTTWAAAGYTWPNNTLQGC
ncbi:hypothetical protein Q5752_007048 [Cryptotrichosporon argae]